MQARTNIQETNKSNYIQKFWMGEGGIRVLFKLYYDVRIT